MSCSFQKSWPRSEAIITSGGEENHVAARRGEERNTLTVQHRHGMLPITLLQKSRRQEEESLLHRESADKKGKDAAYAERPEPRFLRVAFTHPSPSPSPPSLHGSISFNSSSATPPAVKCKPKVPYTSLSPPPSKPPALILLRSFAPAGPSFVPALFPGRFDVASG
ncbi:hypothetical protein EYF80_039582 [Liparis tanakae]|uniref:Uncharacterized protein n=1 Tax=Liparis tanakae TaxID=230148 RepID=A0A4Z2GAG0_9TELE|nr:hypothetical protein EYF80_039582 [Liparis tanakae]